jgi:hypothetical protein
MLPKVFVAVPIVKYKPINKFLFVSFFSSIHDYDFEWWLSSTVLEQRLLSGQWLARAPPVAGQQN